MLGTRRLQSLAAEEAQQEEEEAIAEHNSVEAIQGLRCLVCSSPSTTRCARCRAVRYYSSSRQKHWREVHKNDCRLGQVVPSPASSSNGNRDLPDIGSSSESPRSASRSGSRTLSDTSEVVAESARATPVLDGTGTLVKPKKILFPYDNFLRYLEWEGSTIAPSGLVYCGDSCFVNVILQCFTHTMPLTGYLLEGTHAKECSRSALGKWCFMCDLQDHVRRVKNCDSPISPIKILSHIRSIGSDLEYGQQEDANEFMRCAIDCLQSICLDKAGGEKLVDPRSQETTLIQHIFGGHLLSQVKCMHCLHDVNRYENMMYLAVEIRECVESLEDALAKLTAPGYLDGAKYTYYCASCHGSVIAWRRLSLHEAPNVLTITLKRFQSRKYRKWKKRVTFPEVLDVLPYMSGKGDTPPLYMLYAVVVHVDMRNASLCGHYICYIKDLYGVWYKIDSKVKQVDLETVMAQEAYILFYRRHSSGHFLSACFVCIRVHRQGIVLDGDARSIARPPPITDGSVPPQPVGGAVPKGSIANRRGRD